MININLATLDNAIKYHEMLIHMTEKRGGRPSVHEIVTLRLLKELREIKEETD